MSTGTQSRRELARQRAAERQRQARRARQRRVFAVIGVVVLAFGVLVGLRLAGVGDKGPSTPTASLDPAVLHDVTSVPSSAFTAVGLGTSKDTLVALKGQPALVSGGKPKLVYVGAEYCPFCAAQRWAVVTALSRFGTWKGLSESHSASDDAYPNTATFSFHGASFTSDHLAFDAVETHTNQKGPDGQYEPLDAMSAEQQQLMRTYDVPPYVPAAAAGSIPFLDMGNRWVVSGSTFMPDPLANLSVQDIASALSDPSTPVSRGVLGAANRLTAAICVLTDQQPSNVCAGVSALKGSVPGA